MAVTKRKAALAAGVKPAYKTIKLRKQHEKEATQIEEEFKLSPIASRTLAARGYKADAKLRTFINPTLKDGLPDPWELKNLDRACELIAECVKGGKPIAICCDFDVDGLSGGAQVAHFFKTIGVKTRVFVPDRFEDGYGLNEGMIRSAVADGCGLLIAIDYGTTNLKELNVAIELGLKTIVIDHHHVGSVKTPADVFINPQQKGCGFAEKVLSASGLAWYLICGLRQKLPQAKNIDAKAYLDLACLGTICDMVPLIGANRVIAKRGLEILSKTERLGLKALKNSIGIYKDVKCSHVGFGIGPRLNAAGRMVHGEMVIDLLTTEDTAFASKLASKLNQLNLDRQDTEGQVKEAAVRRILGWGMLPSGIVVHDPEFHTGVIGIVAQRLVEMFYRPSAVLGLDKDGIYKGSVRGIKGFSVVEALHSVGEHLLKFGGHEGAGGFSVREEKIDDFTEAWVSECEKRLADIVTEPFVEADTTVKLQDITMGLIDELGTFAPFGMGNPGPILYAENLRVSDIKVLKGAHLKAMLTDGSRYIAGLMWNQTEHPAISYSARVNVAFRPDYNNFNGVTELQAVLQAVEPA